MKSVQDYIDNYTGIAKNLGYSGESVDVLVQLLANASYISEVENASYMAEASLEKAGLLNSKIQHCVDNMYSVFRGSCPRVILKIKPTKYITLNPYDLLIESQSFRVYYLGYYTVLDADGNSLRSTVSGVTDPKAGEEDEGGDGGESDSSTTTTGTSNIIDITSIEDGDSEGSDSGDEGEESEMTIEEWVGGASIDELLLLDGTVGKWEYSSATFYPVIDDDDKENYQVLVGFIAPKRIGDNLTIDKVINTNNTYYVDCIAENLSDDMYVKIASTTEDIDSADIQGKTRIFAEHILGHKIFDLTLPAFGSRLYVANYYKDVNGRNSQDLDEIGGMTPNARVFAQYYGFSELDEYNSSELRKIQYKGAELVPFAEVTDRFGEIHSNPFLVKECLTEYDGAEGICYIDAIPRDDINTIHYKASRDRYVNSILRSNSDIGTVLEEAYPDVIISGGTNYNFQAESSSNRYSYINLYYIPKNENRLLSDLEIEDFRKEKRAYYAITSVISVEPGHKYVATFNINIELFRGSTEDYDELIGQEILISNYEKKFGVLFDSSTIKDIETLIGKISNVKKINDIQVSYTDAGAEVEESDINTDNAYFEIKYSITTSVTKAN